MDRSYCDWCETEFKDEQFKWLKNWIRIYDRGKDQDCGMYAMQYGTEKHELCPRCLAQAQKLLNQLKEDLKPSHTPGGPVTIVMAPEPTPEPKCQCWLHKLADHLCGAKRDS